MVKEVLLRNGKTLKQALEEVREYKAPVKKDYQGHSYYKFGEYKQRLDEAFGKDGYSVSYFDYETAILPCLDSSVNPVFLKANCRIAIYNEEGDVVMTADGIGTDEVERDKSKQGYLHLNNIGIFLQQAAFKSAARTLNIFDCNRFDNSESGSSGERNDKTMQSQKTQARGTGGAAKDGSGKKETCDISLVVEQPLLIMSTDRQTGLPIYILEGRKIVSADKCSERVSKVIMYPNCYKRDADRVNKMVDFRNCYRLSIKVTDGKPEEAYENVYIFKGFSQMEDRR